MIIDALKVTNSRSEVLNLPLDDTSGGFSVQEIGGLGPVKTTLVSSSFANLDGEQYHSSRREPRNITLKLGLHPDYATESVADIRAILYQYFLTKGKLLLTFHMYDKFALSVLNEFRDLDISAYVETFDPEIFTKDPTSDISLMCFDPDFYDPTMVVFDGETVSNTDQMFLSYDGTVDTGVIFTLRPDRNLDDFSIYYTGPDGVLKTVTFSYPLLAGDVLTISSVVGSKSAVLTRAGVESSVLYAISAQSSWLTMQPGNNGIRVYATGAPIPFDIQYLTRFGGL